MYSRTKEPTRKVRPKRSAPFSLAMGLAWGLQRFVRHSPDIRTLKKGSADTPGAAVQFPANHANHANMLMKDIGPLHAVNMDTVALGNANPLAEHGLAPSEILPFLSGLQLEGKRGCLNLPYVLSAARSERYNRCYNRFTAVESIIYIYYHLL